jgi:hypothetical protein
MLDGRKQHFGISDERLVMFEFVQFEVDGELPRKEEVRDRGSP